MKNLPRSKRPGWNDRAWEENTIKEHLSLDTPAEPTEPAASNGNGQVFAGTKVGWLKVANDFVGHIKTTDEGREYQPGWLAMLSEIEVKVWLVMKRFISPDGITYITPPSIAKLLRCNQRNVERAIARLTSLGLLVTIDAGGGRNRPAKRMPRVPENPGACADDSNPGAVAGESGETPAQDELNTGAQEKKPRRASGINPGADEQETPAHAPDEEDLLRRPLKKTSKRDNNNKTGGCAAVVVGSRSSRGEKERPKQQHPAYEALKHFGIIEPTRSMLLEEIPQLTAEAVIELSAQWADSDIDPPVGRLVNLIRSEAAAMIETQAKETAQNAIINRNKLEVIEAEIDAATKRFDAHPEKYTNVPNANWHFAKIRLDDLIGFDSHSCPFNIHNAMEEALRVFDYEQREIQEQTKRQAEAARAERMAKEKAQADEHRRREEERRKAEEDAKAAAKKKIEDFKATFTPEAWQQQVATYFEKWPATRSALSTHPELLTEDIKRAIESKQMERVA